MLLISLARMLSGAKFKGLGWNTLAKSAGGPELSGSVMECISVVFQTCLLPISRHSCLTKMSRLNGLTLCYALGARTSLKNLPNISPSLWKAYWTGGLQLARTDDN